MYNLAGYSNINSSRHFGTVDAMGIYILGTDIMGVSIFGIGIPAPTRQSSGLLNYKIVTERNQFTSNNSKIRSCNDINLVQRQTVLQDATDNSSNN